VSLQPIDILTSIKGFEETTSAKSSDRPIKQAVIDPAYVASSFPGTLPKVTFEGETVLSTKFYPVADPYWPEPGDRVWMVPIGTTYMIVGSTDNPNKSISPVWNTYTPVVGNDGSATYTTLTGRWKRIAPLTIAFTVYMVVNAAGSGTSEINVTAPTNIDRATRQVVVGSIEGFSSNPLRDAQLLSFVSGSGAVWDRVRFTSTTVGGALVSMDGSQLQSGLILVFQGVYREG
jgi:hypothetical protein